jgi:hypothetical protein
MSCAGVRDPVGFQWKRHRRGAGDAFGHTRASGWREATATPTVGAANAAAPGATWPLRRRRFPLTAPQRRMRNRFTRLFTAERIPNGGKIAASDCQIAACSLASGHVR